MTQPHRELRPAPPADGKSSGSVTPPSSRSPAAGAATTTATATLTFPRSPIPSTTNSPRASLIAAQTAIQKDGYRILRGAIPRKLADEVCALFDAGLPPRGASETQRLYTTPIQAYVLRDEFSKISNAALADLYTPIDKQIPPMPAAISVGEFLPSDGTNIRYSLLHTGGSKYVYVTIALSTCKPETGMYNLLKGSHRERHPQMTPVGDWQQQGPTLEPGDACIWRGDISYLLSPGGGGRWCTLTFDWGPGMVDLTS